MYYSVFVTLFVTFMFMLLWKTALTMVSFRVSSRFMNIELDL